MRSLFRTILTLACALYLGGAHWMVLQVTAWTGMLVARAPEVGVSLAVETTFDGDHPCSLCSAVQTGKEEEREQQPLSKVPGMVKELKLVSLKRCTAPQPVAMGEIQWADLTEASWRSAEPPPTPPPLA